MLTLVTVLQCIAISLFTCPTPPHPLTSIIITHRQVREQLSNIWNNSNINPSVLKVCAESLAGVFPHLRDLSLRLKKVPPIWKTSCIVLVSKKGRPSALNDFRLTQWLSMTSHVKKTCERPAAPLTPGETLPGSLAVGIAGQYKCGSRHHLPAPQGLHTPGEATPLCESRVLRFLQCLQHYQATPDSWKALFDAGGRQQCAFSIFYFSMYYFVFKWENITLSSL